MVPMGVCAGIPTLVSTLLGDPMGEPIVGEANMLMYGWLPRVAVTTLPNRQQLSIHQLIVGIFYAWALMHVLCVAARARVSFVLLLIVRSSCRARLRSRSTSEELLRLDGERERLEGIFYFFQSAFVPAPRDAAMRRCLPPRGPTQQQQPSSIT